jgi:hypothetical protein
MKEKLINEYEERERLKDNNNKIRIFFLLYSSS